MWKIVIADLVVVIFGTTFYHFMYRDYPKICCVVAILSGMAWLALPALIIIALFMG